MARRRRAVGRGSTKKRPARGHPSGSTNEAKSTNAGKSNGAMSSGNTRPKRNPRRAAKDRFEEHRLMTSPNSQLVDLDLVKLLARPEAWDCLEEAEKQEILNLLQEDVHPNPHPPLDDPNAKIPPLSQAFLRYSNDWRDGVRQFQLDLQLGRYDPEWLRQAEEASQQRAAGEFDKFKEQEFEEFWGQKQKVDQRLAPGESSQVRLTTLVEKGVIQKGDIWRFSRVFTNGGKNKVLVEKEAKVVDIKDGKLTFLIPPGQRIFLPAVDSPKLGSSSTNGTSNSVQPFASVVQTKDHAKGTGDLHLNGNDTQTAGATQLSRPSKRARTIAKSEHDNPPTNDATESGPTTESTATFAVEIHSQPAGSELEQPPADNATEANSEAEGSHQETPKSVHPKIACANEDSTTPVAAEVDGVLISDIQSPSALLLKIVEIDGRVTGKISHGNSWKDFRCYRDNQDMGSLFDIRYQWHSRKK
ncbi:Asx homology domain-containing protein [Aspergillus floccosus]